VNVVCCVSGLLPVARECCLLCEWFTACSCCIVILLLFVLHQICYMYRRLIILICLSFVIQELENMLDCQRYQMSVCVYDDCIQL